MVFYAGFYLKFTFSGKNVTCYTAITPTNVVLPKHCCIICDSSNYYYTLSIPSTLVRNLMVNNTAVANQTGTVPLIGASGTFVDENSSYSKFLLTPTVFYSVLF